MSFVSLHPIARTSFFFFFFNDTATTEIYTLSLHDALPILGVGLRRRAQRAAARMLKEALDARLGFEVPVCHPEGQDRKSTRLNSSHANISYAVFCLKKKKNETSSLSVSALSQVNRYTCAHY